VYSDFYEIPLPTLRFEKTEEIDIDKKSNDTEERNDAFQIDTRKKNDVRKITTLTNQRQGSQHRTLKNSRNERRFQKERKTTRSHATSTFQNDTQQNDDTRPQQGSEKLQEFL
jgi:hypothetical protein